MTKKEFCKLHTSFYGEEITNLKQIAMIQFTGEELKHYVEHFIRLCVVGVTLPTKEQMVSELERLTANKFVNNRNESIQYIFGFNACFDWLKNKLKDNGN